MKKLNIANKINEINTNKNSITIVKGKKLKKSYFLFTYYII